MCSDAIQIACHLLGLGFCKKKNLRRAGIKSPLQARIFRDFSTSTTLKQANVTLIQPIHSIQFRMDEAN